MSVLDYASPQATPPRWRIALYHLRFVLLAAYAALVGGAVWFYADVGVEAVFLAVALLIFFSAQGLFLIGMPQLRWPRPVRRKPMWMTIVAGALAAGLLTFGLIMTIMSALDVWKSATESIGLHLFWAVLITWAAWLVVFGIMWTGEWFRGFQTMYKLICAGTWLEILITIPIDVHVRKKTDCWCGEGTFFALVAGSTVAFWSFGPGIVLLFLTRRLQREGYFSLCGKCGRDLTNITEKRCPHCSARIPQRRRPSSAASQSV
jgi:DNA-directed RNA polymerase subunit RPC12/RpoP